MILATESGIARFIRSARRKPVLAGGVKVSAVVGTILNLINQMPGWLDSGEIGWPNLLLNYLVPFCVSVYSAARIDVRDAKRSDDG